MAIVIGLGFWVSGQRIGPLTSMYGLILALVAVAGVVSALFAPDNVEAWRRGAIGEEQTGEALAKLPSTFVVLHDRRIPGSRANIDHIVIGPPGVFVVETKRYSGKLTVRGMKSSWPAGVEPRSWIKPVERPRWLRRSSPMQAIRGPSLRCSASIAPSCPGEQPRSAGYASSPAGD